LEIIIHLLYNKVMKAKEKNIIDRTADILLGSALLMLFFVIVAVYSPKAKSQSVNIGGLSINVSWCKQVQNVSAIMNSLSNVQLPVNGGLGTTFGIIKTDNPIVGFCDFMIGLERLDGINAIWYTADQANQMFELKKNQEIGLMRDFYDLTTKTYNFESSEFNKEKMFTPGYARRIDGFYRDVADYHDENIAESSDEAFNVQTRRERERDMRKLSRLAQKKETLSEIIACEDKESLGGPNYQEISKEMAGLRQIVDDNKRLAEDSINSLNSMSLKISNDLAQNAEIQKDINDMVQFGLSFDSVILSFQENSKTRVEVDSPGDDPVADKTKLQDDTVDQKYQRVDVRVDQSYLEKPMKKWGELWSGYVKSRAMGSLSKNKDDLEEEFKNLSVECGPNRIIRQNNLDFDDPDFRYKQKRLSEECIEASRKKTARAGGLFKEHLQMLFDHKKAEREAQARIYTLESKHLGVFRSFKVAEAQDKEWEESYSRTEITCGDAPSMATMQRQQVELEKTNLEANTIIAEQLAKQNALKKVELDKEKRRRESEEERREIFRANDSRKIKAELETKVLDI